LVNLLTPYDLYMSCALVTCVWWSVSIT